MRAIILFLVFACGVSASANEVRHEVARSSDLERELGYKLSVQDKHDAWRADGLHKIFPITGPAPEYTVRFDATTVGRLKDLFGLSLTLRDVNGILVQVPLETRSKFSDDLAQLHSRMHPDAGEAPSRQLSIQFLIKKEMLNYAVFTIRCGTGMSEESYSIRLIDYAPETTKP